VPSRYIMQHGTLWVMHGYRSDTYGESFADVYDAWYSDVSDVAATVEKIAALAGHGTVLELGVGTGRLAIPLAAAGTEVVGLDSSPTMIRQLRTKPEGSAIPTVMADMAAPPFHCESFDVAFAAFNTFFNLATIEGQSACVGRLAEIIRPGGVLVIEGFLPPAGGLSEGGTSVREVTLESVVLTVSKHDPHTQRIVGQHVEISAAGIRMRPWMLRYLTPPQLDELFGQVGFVLESRHSGWRDEPFDPDGEVHVSVYRLGPNPVAGNTT